jgi:hypothetical protein
MKLIFIYGMPATGKFTVARELASATGYKLFHNHLVVDCLLPVFDFGSQPFVEVREQIWLSVFDQVCRSHAPGLIFTFAPERTVRPKFISQALDVVSCAGGEISFIELVCPLNELKIRLGHASRQEYRKLTSVPLFEQLHAEGSFESSHMPEPQLRLDTSLCSPARAALQIIQKLELAILARQAV